jgi:hypothetical protein
LEIIYKSNQRTKQSRLGFENRQSVLIKREAQALYSNVRQGVLKSEAQALVFKDEGRQCFVEVHIDNRSKIIII